MDNRVISIDVALRRAAEDTEKLELVSKQLSRSLYIAQEDEQKLAAWDVNQIRANIILDYVNRMQETLTRARKEIDKFYVNVEGDK